MVSPLHEHLEADFKLCIHTLLAPLVRYDGALAPWHKLLVGVHPRDHVIQLLWREAASHHSVRASRLHMSTVSPCFQRSCLRHLSAPVVLAPGEMQSTDEALMR